MALVALILVPASPKAQEADHSRYVSPWKTPWTYEQSERWAELDPAYAACNGKQQSPIDIRDTQKADLPVLRFEHASRPLKYVINNGATIRVNYYAPGSGSFVVVGGERYQLTQFHFHRPSEEQVHGKAYDMVIHLMYQSAGGKVIGVAVLLKAGKANATIQQLWDHMPEREGQQEVNGVEFSPSGLVPRATAYYMYMGSLTAPPCTEGVMWFVLKTPLNISKEEISAFARLFPHDVRPVQPLNGRIVQESR